MKAILFLCAALLFFDQSKVFAATQNDCQGRFGENLLINPTKSEQPTNRWFTTVWSICAKDVAVVGGDLASAESKPLRLLNKNGAVEISLNTKDIVLEKTPLATVVTKKTFEPAVAPWSTSDGFDFSVPVSVQMQQIQGSAVSYLSASFIITSKKTKKSFWLMVALFDPRNKSGLRSEHLNDVQCSPSKGTKLPMAETLAFNGSSFLLMQPRSASFEQKPFPTEKFSFQVKRENLHEILSKLNSSAGWCLESGDFPMDEAGYELHQASVMFEAHVGKRAPAVPSTEQWVNTRLLMGAPQLTLK